MRMWLRQATLTLGGNQYTLDGLNFSFKVQFEDRAKVSTAQLEVYNLSPSTRASLKKGDAVIITAGYKGDVGWVIVSDFDADAVLQTGAEAEPNTARNHAPEDGLFVGGVCPDGKAPTGLPGNAVVVAAGGIYIAVSADGVKINGNVTVTGTLSAGGIEMTTHTHPGDSGGTTGGPQ